MSHPNYKHTKKYDADNTTRIALKLNDRTDKDILDFLEKSGNKQGTIKNLIREEIKRQG
jgi:hypothetical protein